MSVFADRPGGCELFVPSRVDSERAEAILRQASDWHHSSAHGGCSITGSAQISEHDGEWRWDMADPAIHITVELLEQLDERGQAFLEAMYEVGDVCPYRPDSRHARRIGEWPAS